MALYNPLIQGVAYSWSSVNLLIEGVPTIGITSLSYSEEREISDVYGIGSNPTARAFGNITRSAEMTLTMNEVNALILASPGRTLHSIPEFSIVVAYLPENGIPVKHILKNCRFTNTPVSVSQNDPSIEIALTLMVGDIQWS